MKADAKLIPDAITEEIKKFQGTWKQIACERDGVVDSVDEFGWEPKSTFTDDTYIVTLANGSIAIKGTFKLDPTLEPKAIDWIDTFGADAGKTFLAIYSLEGRPTGLLCRRRRAGASHGIPNAVRASPPRLPARDAVGCRLAQLLNRTATPPVSSNSVGRRDQTVTGQGTWFSPG